MIPFALAICASGCSGIGENDAATNADLRTLAGPEISRLLTGNTVLGRDRLGPFWMHYPSQSTVWGLASNGDVDIGRWWISGNHYCRAWRRWRGGEEQCWLVASDGSSRLLWIEPDGRSSAESTIEAGNTIGGRDGRKLAAADAIGSDVASGDPTGSDETVPVDAAGLILVARQPEGARGGEPGGIDSGGVDGGGGAGAGGNGSGGNGSGGNGNGSGGNGNGDQDGSGAGGDDGDRDGKGRGHGRGGNNGDGDDGDD
jgi:hypothetical protein